MNITSDTSTRITASIVHRLIRSLLVGISKSKIFPLRLILRSYEFYLGRFASDKLLSRRSTFYRRYVITTKWLLRFRVESNIARTKYIFCVRDLRWIFDRVSSWLKVISQRARGRGNVVVEQAAESTKSRLRRVRFDDRRW